MGLKSLENVVNSLNLVFGYGILSRLAKTLYYTTYKKYF